LLSHPEDLIPKPSNDQDDCERDERERGRETERQREKRERQRERDRERNERDERERDIESILVPKTSLNTTRYPSILTEIRCDHLDSDSKALILTPP